MHLDKGLQYILLAFTILFLLYIINMVKKKKLELKYSLMWIGAGVGFIVLTISTEIIMFISRLMHIKEIVNAIYLIIIFFLIMIVFYLTVSASKNSARLQTLAQEVALIKNELETLKDDLLKKSN